MIALRKSFLVPAAALAMAFVALRGPFLAGTPTTIARGPYLQDVGTADATIVWQTDTPVVGGVRYGRVPGPPWEFTETGGAAATTHVIRLDDLVPDTRYAFQLTADGLSLTGLDHFRTYPPHKSTKPFRFVAWGDSGTGAGPQLQLASFLDQLAPRPDLMLGLGDLVYENGEWENYDPNFFLPYRNQLRRSMIWPSIGNHEKITEAGAPFYTNFHLPTDTGAPGHPSGTEQYYSFDHGMAHFVCIDTSENIAVDDAQHSWLSDDLDDAIARGMRWKIIFTHKPPYTKGSHDSEFEGDLISIQNNVVPLIESKGVDLFIAGHSHNYERSFLAAGGSVQQGHPTDYTKTTSGTIYVVTGCGGKSGHGTFDHPLMSFGIGMTTGHSVFDVSNEEIRGYFLEHGSDALDLFTLRKDTDLTAPRLASVKTAGAANDQVLVTFSEPVLGGAGASGAENLANYTVVGGAGDLTIASATLQSDQRTALLQTTAPATGAAYFVIVNNVADLSPATNVINPNSVLSFVLEPTSGVPQGDTWSYFKGMSFPGATWTSLGFADGSWLTGPTGIGFGDGDDATFLGDMQGNYLTVYARRAFVLADASTATNLTLRVSYDDGFVAFLNGTEVARVNVPAGQDEATAASGTHEAEGFESFDLSGFLGLLEDGNNVLAVEGHNASISSGDFSLHPVLQIVGQNPAGDQAPIAVLVSDVHTLNIPGAVTFGTSFSYDPDGTITSTLLDFGDGTPPSTASQVTHTYSQVGLYTASLVVTDNQGLQTIDEIPIFAHNVGSAPSGALGVSDAFPDAGVEVSFDSAGSVDPDGGAVTIHWNFGDPASGDADYSVDPAPTHTYAALGDYTVSLLITDDEGSQVRVEQEISVGGEPPPPPPPGDGGGGGGGGGCYVSGGPDEPADLSFLLALLATAGLLAFNARRLRRNLSRAA